MNATVAAVETATVTIGTISAQGDVVRREGGLTTVRVAARQVITGHEVQPLRRV